MANQLVNYFNKRRNRTSDNSASESESPESKWSKNQDESVEHVQQDGDVIIDALEMTGEIAGTLLKRNTREAAKTRHNRKQR